MKNVALGSLGVEQFETINLNKSVLQPDSGVFLTAGKPAIPKRPAIGMSIGHFRCRLVR